MLKKLWSQKRITKNEGALFTLIKSKWSIKTRKHWFYKSNKKGFWSEKAGINEWENRKFIKDSLLVT